MQALSSPFAVLPRCAVLLVAILLATTALGDAPGFARFHGVWVGSGVIVGQGQPASTRNSDLAIWETASGLELTLRTFTHDGTARIHSRLAAGHPVGTFRSTRVEPLLQKLQSLRARVDGEQLVVVLSSVDETGVESIARYAYSVSDRRMRLQYTLTIGGEVLQSGTGDLIRAKVVM